MSWFLKWGEGRVRSMVQAVGWLRRSARPLVVVWQLVFWSVFLGGVFFVSCL